MKLIVLGATGPSGQQVVALALEAGHEVTAVARTPSKITTAHDKLKVGSMQFVPSRANHHTTLPYMDIVPYILGGKAILRKK